MNRTNRHRRITAYDSMKYNQLSVFVNVLGVNLLNLFMSKINNYKFIEFILLSETQIIEILLQ